jgi:outer membrane protein assembly factor BamA
MRPFLKVFLLLFIWLGLGPNDAISQIVSSDSLSLTPSYNDTLDVVTITELIIEGNRRTKEKIILRELEFREGKTFLRSKLKEITENDQSKLMNTRLFVTVDITLIEDVVNEVRVLIELNESWYTYPQPLIDIAENNFNSWWTNTNRDLRRLEYGIKFSQRNMRGRNETLRLTTLFGFTKTFDLLYVFPFVDRKQKHGISIQGNYNSRNNEFFKTANHAGVQINDSLRQLRGISEIGAGQINYTYRPNFYDFHGVNFGYRYRRVDDTLAILNPGFLLDGRTQIQYLLLDYRYRRDKRNNSAYPTKGSFFLISFTKHGLGVFDDINQLDIALDYMRYFDLGKNFFYATKFAAYYTTPNEQPYILQRGLGYGKNVLRGMERYRVESNVFLLQKNDFRKLIFSRRQNLGDYMPIKQFRIIPIAVYGKVHADFGYTVVNFSNPESTLLSDRFLYSFGVGLDVVLFNANVFRFELSFNTLKDWVYWANSGPGIQ